MILWRSTSSVCAHIGSKILLKTTPINIDEHINMNCICVKLNQSMVLETKAPFERDLVEDKHSAYQEFVKYYMLLIRFRGDYPCYHTLWLRFDEINRIWDNIGWNSWIELNILKVQSTELTNLRLKTSKPSQIKSVHLLLHQKSRWTFLNVFFWNILLLQNWKTNSFLFAY